MSKLSPDPASAAGLRAWLRKHFSLEGEMVMQWASMVIVLTLMVSYVLDHPASHAGTRFYAGVLALTAILLVNILWDDIARRFPLREHGELACLGLSVVLIIAIVGVTGMYNALYLVFMLSSQANLILRRFWPAQIITLLAMAGYFGALWFTGSPPQALTGVTPGMLIGLVFVITLSQVLIRYGEQTERAERLAAELLAARRREQELAVAEERLRLAREIHDGLGHHLTVLAIQLQAAEKLLAKDPALAVEPIQLSRAEAQAALREVRQSVASLRQNPVDGRSLPEALADLVRDFDRRATIHAELRFVGDPRELPPAVTQTLFRVAQEGLTNAQKHARAARLIAVCLEYRADEVCLSVEDDGQPAQSAPDAASPTGGFGLTGLRERVTQLRGSFSAGPLTAGSMKAGGFRVEAHIPIVQTDQPEGDAT